MAVEDGREAEGGPVVADPNAGEFRPETEIGVVKLGFELVFACLVVGQAGLDGQDADVAGLPGEPLHQVEAEAGLLHGVVGHEREELDAARGGRIRADRLELEEEERVLGPQEPGGETGRKEDRDEKYSRP